MRFTASGGPEPVRTVIHNLVVVTVATVVGHREFFPHHGKDRLKKICHDLLDSVAEYRVYHHAPREVITMQALTIGKVARRAEVGVETVRFYERQGLIAAPQRARSGYRLYPEDTVARIRFIRRAKALGFTLRDIRELLALRVDPEISSAEIKACVQEKMTAIAEKIRTLQRMHETLVRLTSVCDGCAPVSACPILEALDTPVEGEEAYGS
jgi:MerR family mercuric resistance operon transcriptional regulator